MRIYEELFIIRPDTPEEEVDAYVGQIQELITSGQGTVDKTEKWGVRKLAYRIQKYGEGIYVLVQFSAPAEVVKEVERRMRVTDSVIKFITVRIDEKLKKIAKRKKQRDKRAARKPAPAAPAPAAPTAPVPGEAAAASVPAPGLPAESKVAEPSKAAELSTVSDPSQGTEPAKAE
jgi:small subunit ribosomal protein S6